MISGLRDLLPRRLKSLLKRLARLPDRLLHSRRRARARARLSRAAPRAESVVFVCYGNICRSPFAARGFEHELPSEARERLTVTSTGFHPEDGRPSPPEAVRAAEPWDVDLASHRSRAVTSEADAKPGSTSPIVFVMTPDQRSRWRRSTSAPASRVFVLGDLDPESIRQRGIRDPFGQPDEVFRDVFGRIQRCIREAAAAWGDDAGGPGDHGVG